ncbi:MAG: hypothetical protein HY801_15680, partial [Candidatus Lindowbacteria bacterium]|nr:hypothetical protein [Candidatus Lindowbacteria bacterium]
PSVQNPDQADADDDGYGDACTVVHVVNTSAQLQSALTAAQSNSKNDVIKLAQGIYGISGNNNQRFLYSSSEPWGLAIKGGYASGFSERQVDPANTILDGEGIYQGPAYGAGVLRIYHGSTAVYRKIVVEGVTIRNGRASSYGGVYAYTMNGDLTFTNNIIKGNSTTQYSKCGVTALTNAGSVVLTNNIVSDNTSAYYYGGVYAQADYGTIKLTNNTITGNSASGRGGLGLWLSNNTVSANLYNNIIWNNTATAAGDIHITNSAGGTVYAYYNDFNPAKVYGTFTEQGNNLNNVNPLFVGGGDYHLGVGSPCIDAGSASAPLLPFTDFEGDDRILGAAPDMGADEY